MPAPATATARRGTPASFTTDSQAGADPARDRENSMGVGRKGLEFALESAAEITTRFITPAAYGIPTAAKARTNGLPVTPPPPSPIVFHGVIITITLIASR